MVRTPDFPARAALQVEGTSPPSGVVAPRPVTTTVGLAMTAPRERWWGRPGRTRAPRPPGSGLLGVLDEGDGVLHGREVGDLLVGDADLELLLGQRDDGHHRQGVDVQVVGEGLLRLDRVGRQTGLLVDDLRQPGQDLLLAVCHARYSNSVWMVRGLWVVREQCGPGRPAAGGGAPGQGRATTCAA